MICGRSLIIDDVEMIRRIIASDPKATREWISREVCQAWSWFKPDGGLKNMSCKVLLLRLHRCGMITLPEPRRSNANGRKFSRRTKHGEAGKEISGPLKSLLPLELIRVTSKKDSYLWNEFVDRYHYLGYTPLPGAQIRYLINSAAGYLCAIGFSAAAWKVAPRDVFIGWNAERRVQNLHLVVNNSRFLILPWVSCKHLASKILSLCLKQLPNDWLKVYGYKPVLMETFVEKDRFAGTCYKAANWAFVGSTQGRGKLDRFKKYKLPVKDIYLYPLDKDFRMFLV
ncbi:hypothetical protein DK28_0200175 [Peptococcaceae bacterium SCADC1_2_3]|nr:hypothetical protein DK28_0200175 [Peptococcaceae bacterium SCADC1_2_3]KFI36076.1 hypothetical protein HY00_08680 [Peptococcaceae bacterium SCADC1_2_3]